MESRRKGRCFGGSICQGGSMQKCTWLKVTQGRAYPRRQLAECPLAAPRDRSHVSRRVFAFAARCKYLERKEGKGVKIFQGWLTQVLLFGLPREGRNHLHGPWTECRVRVQAENTSGSSRRPAGRQRLSKGCKRCASPGQRGQGKLEGG